MPTRHPRRIVSRAPSSFSQTSSCRPTSTFRGFAGARLYSQGVLRTSAIQVAALLAASLALISGCGGSGGTPPTDRAAELREDQAQVEGQLILIKVEEAAAEYEVAQASGELANRRRALKNVLQAAHTCWEFGIKECSEMSAIEEKVEALEADVHHRLVFTTLK